MKFLFTFLMMALLFSPFSYAQKILRYEGAFVAGDKAPAQANYSYYLNKSGKKVKHGAFRYMVKEARNSGNFKQRYVVNFQGEYENGKKVGEWSYRIMSRNYDFNKENYYFTKEISLEANYSKGLANSEWVYFAKVTKRQLLDKARGKWSGDQDVKDVYIKLNFTNGLLRDSLIINDKMGTEIVALMNKQGMLHGDFKMKVSGSKEKKEKFQKGLFMDYNESQNKFLPGAQVQAYNEHIKNSETLLNVDTLSYLKANSDIGKLLLAEVFNGNVFKYRFIDGDDMMVFHQNKYQFSKSFKGLYYLHLKPKFSKEEQAVIRELYAVNQFLDVQRQKLERARTAKPNDAVIKRKHLSLMTDIKRLKLLICLSKQVKLNVSTKVAVSKANKACGNLPEAFDRMSRAELLKRMQTEARQLKAKNRLVD